MKLLESADQLKSWQEYREYLKETLKLLDGEEPVLTDFGLAKDVGGSSHRSPTVSGQTIGTPAYMSPEQARG